LPDAPDCAWCDTALVPQRIHGTEGDPHYLCDCCGKVTRVDREGVSHRVLPTDVRDVNGVVMYDP